MIKSIVKIFLTVNLLLLVACAPYSLVPANNAVDLKGFSVTPGADWNKSAHKPGAKAESWTSNGEVLDQLILIGDINDGEALLKTQNKSLPMPKFTADMLPFDVENLVKTSIKNLANGEIEVQTENLQPASFGGVPGFRFNITFFTQGGLLKTGDVLGAVKNEKLYLMIYTAADLHYYRNRLPEVEKIFASAVL